MYGLQNFIDKRSVVTTRMQSYALQYPSRRQVVGIAASRQANRVEDTRDEDLLQERETGDESLTNLW